MKIALLLPAMGIGACAAAPEPPAKPPEPCPPVDTVIALNASERVNATAEGEGRPVQVRVYRLRGETRLRGATFEEIWQADREALQTDLASVSEYTVYPGKTQLVTLKPDAEAHFVALVALFREPQGNDWFLTYELERAPETPPCAETGTIPVWLDRMQIQDGEGRSEPEGSAPETPPQETTLEETTSEGEGGG